MDSFVTRLEAQGGAGRVDIVGADLALGLGVELGGPSRRGSRLGRDYSPKADRLGAQRTQTPAQPHVRAVVDP